MLIGWITAMIVEGFLIGMIIFLGMQNSRLIEDNLDLAYQVKVLKLARKGGGW